MIEKFDLTKCIDMDGNYSSEDIEQIEKLNILIQKDRYDINLHLEKARIFASCYDTIHAVIAYCRIIQDFKDNLVAYVELADYFKNYDRYDWAMITCIEGLSHYYHDQRLKSILKEAIDYSEICK